MRFLMRTAFAGLCRCVLAVAVVLAAAPALADAVRAPLVEAARRGDAVAVGALLGRNVAVDSASADGTTALHWAAQLGHVELVTLLLGRGASVNVKNRYGVTPLRAACEGGDVAIVDALLKAGADPNTVREESGDTPLMIAARSGHTEVVRALLARGAHIDHVEPVRQQTALMWAAAEKHAHVVKLLLDAGADPGRLSSTKISPLMFAIRAGDLESTRLLLDTGFDPNATAADGTRMLHFAIINARFDIAAYLLGRGADVKAPDPHGTPLQLLSFLRRAEAKELTDVIARQLPQSGVDAFQLAKALLKHGDDINARYRFPMAPRHLAFGFYRIQLTGATPFFIAAITADVPWMRFLAANGADPSIPTVANITPLLGAAGVGFWPGITHGTNAEALEAVRLAADLGNDPRQVVQGGDVPDRMWEGATAMHGAALRNAEDVATWLASKGVGLDVKTKAGVSPYHIAVHNAIGRLYGNMVFLVGPEVAERLLKLAQERGQTIDTSPPPPLESEN